MENFKQLLRLAKKLELKYITAQPATSSEDDAVKAALQSAGLWELSNQAAPLLNAARVPDDASVEIKINVKPGPSVSYTALVNPTLPTPPEDPNDLAAKKKYDQEVAAKKLAAQKSSQSLSLLLLKQFSKQMMTAIQKANATPTDLVILNWIKF